MSSVICMQCSAIYSYLWVYHQYCLQVDTMNSANIGKIFKQQNCLYINADLFAVYGKYFE